MEINPDQLMVVQIFGALGTVLATWLLIGKIILPLGKRISALAMAWEKFMEDWSGIESRPGRDRVPGVMERLNEIDGQLKNNGGSSVKDAVDRIEISVNEIYDKTDSIDLRLAEGDQKFDKIEERLNKIEKDLNK
jgi:archaellum component FlaC